MSLGKKAIGYKTIIVNEPIYDDELVKNMTMKICYEVTNTNPTSVHIPINVCLEGYNRYELCADNCSDCSVCFGEKSLFS